MVLPPSVVLVGKPFVLKAATLSFAMMSNYPA
jgi:hypothetical protein